MLLACVSTRRATCSLLDAYVDNIPLNPLTAIDSIIPQYDGTVTIFDVDTKGIARKLKGHTRQIQSVSWSEDGRYLLSSSLDWKCILWDLKDGSRVKTVRFEAPVFIGELHPANYLLFVTALFEDQPRLVDLSAGKTKKHVLPSAPRQAQLEGETSSDREKQQVTTVSIFSRSGAHILAGTNKGWVNIIDTKTRATLFSTRLTSCVIITLRLTESGRDVVVNASDRIIRSLHIPDLDDPAMDFDSFRIENEHKYQDIVNRLSWNHVAISPTGEYVTASIYMNHHLYVWETGHSSLEKILEGPKEELSFVEVIRFV